MEESIEYDSGEEPSDEEAEDPDGKPETSKEYRFENVVDSKSGRKRKKVIFDDSSDDDELVAEKSVETKSKSDAIPNIKLSDKEKELKDKIAKALTTLKTHNVTPEDADSSSGSDDDGEMDDDVDETAPWASDAVTSDSGMDVDDSEDDVSEAEDEGLPSTDFNWKKNMAEKAATEFITRQASKQDLWKMVY
ncbi:unnamed protein product, partial [Nesidiocoris tenuis]